MYEVCKEGKTGIGHVNEYPTMHYFGNPKHSANDSIYDFDWVFPEIPVKNCIMGYSYNALLGKSTRIITQ